MNIILLGNDSAGKTEVLYSLYLGKKINIIPTIGFNVETITHQGITFTIWDSGGQDKVRILYKQFYKQVYGIIFVIDSNDLDRIDESKEEFEKIMAEEELKNCFVLVMANKQDLNGSLSPEDVSKILGMETLNGRSWIVLGTSVKTGQGLKESLDWMASEVYKKRK